MDSHPRKTWGLEGRQMGVFAAASLNGPCCPDPETVGSSQCSDKSLVAWLSILEVEIGQWKLCLLPKTKSITRGGYTISTCYLSLQNVQRIIDAWDLKTREEISHPWYDEVCELLSLWSCFKGHSIPGIWIKVWDWAPGDVFHCRVKTKAYFYI
jgi:hypothetical protein